MNTVPDPYMIPFLITFLMPSIAAIVIAVMRKSRFRILVMILSFICIALLILFARDETICNSEYCGLGDMFYEIIFGSVLGISALILTIPASKAK